MKTLVSTILLLSAAALVGLYTRNPDYSARSFPVALRAGVIIRMKQQ